MYRIKILVKSQYHLVNFDINKNLIEIKKIEIKNGNFTYRFHF